MTRRFDDSGIELSEGQWRKLALARTYFKKAKIMIFDEPSSALDAESKDRIFEQFASMKRDRCRIMISHRLSAARLADRIIVIDGVKIVESGTHDELVSANGLYANLYNRQRAKYVTEETK